MVPSTRPATHAGSWYTSSTSELSSQLKQWIGAASKSERSRFAVGPHAGYTFCGPVLAHTYGSIKSDVKRLFVMGPSHCEYFRGFRTTRFSEYDTPLGPVPIDTAVTHSFHKYGVKYLSEDTDLAEHGIELHTPFIKYVAPNAHIVPLVFGEVDAAGEALALDLLRPFFADPNTAFVVSSDFCHWGRRFGFVRYAPSSGAGPAAFRTLAHTSHIERPIYESIEELDRLAMDVASVGDAKAWKKYIRDTGNTICGQRPLGILLELGEIENAPLRFKWKAYSQSSRVDHPRDSSVSYAAGVA